MYKRYRSDRFRSDCLKCAKQKKNKNKQVVWHFKTNVVMKLVHCTQRKLLWHCSDSKGDTPHSIYWLSSLLSLSSSEIVHVWKDSHWNGEGPKHSAQMVVDGVNFLTETVYSISAQPTKVLTNWVADKIAPSYWKPNAEITVSWMNWGDPIGLSHSFRYSSLAALSFVQKEFWTYRLAQASLPWLWWGLLFVLFK